MKRTVVCKVSFLVLCIGCVSLAGCDRTRTPHPTAPTLVAALPVDAISSFQLGAFVADRSSSDQMGVYYDGHSAFFQFRVPAGEYLLIYTTRLGSFYIVFRAKSAALITVGLQAGDLMYDAQLFRGMVTARVSQYENEVIQVFSEFGAREGWPALFQRDAASPAIVLLGNIGVTYIPEVILELTLARPAIYVLEYWTNHGEYHQERFQSSVWFEMKAFPLQPGESIQDAYITIL